MVQTLTQSHWSLDRAEDGSQSLTQVVLGARHHGPRTLDPGPGIRFGEHLFLLLVTLETLGADQLEGLRPGGERQRVE